MRKTRETFLLPKPIITPVQDKSSTSNAPGALSRRRQQKNRAKMSLSAEATSEGGSIPLQNRFTFKYQNLMNTFKDDNKKAENHEEALEDPNFDEYHNMKGREEDDDRKSKTIENRTPLQSSHMVDPAVPDRHGQVAVTRLSQYATHQEWERLSNCTSDGEGFIVE